MSEWRHGEFRRNVNCAEDCYLKIEHGGYGYI